MLTFRSTVATMALLASLGIANAQVAQPQDKDTHHPDAAAPTAAAPAAPSGAMGMDKMMGGNMEQMMPMMRMMMRSMMGGTDVPGMPGLRHIEGQIAFYRAELHIADAQAAQWDAFADALRAGAKRLQDVYMAVQQGNALPSAPDQLGGRRQLLTAELEILQTTEPAARTLYAALSAEQKKAADELMADHLRRM
jgi:hypothetical protein